MKKGIVCILLAFLCIAPLLVSCVQEVDIKDTAAEIYTFYMIVDESTTPEALREVELHLNRTMFYRNGVIVKLVALSEEEYDRVIDEKIAEVEAYQLAKKNRSTSSAAESTDESAESATESSEETSEVVKTGEYWLDELTDGRDIILEEPRIDIFIARGYERYYDLASSGKLSALDEKLNNEAKALKSSIHSTLFTAVKVNKKTYGVPVNTAIGEYTYLAFDKELLEKYSIDSNTIESMEDLNTYLSVIKENEPDVVPLKSAAASANINFLVHDGYPALISAIGEVVPSYTNTAVRNYLAMIARYNSYGYFEAENSSASPRYAVRIETGTFDEIKANLESDGREYEYSLYANPVATNENTVDNVICISATVNSSNLTAVSEIVTTIYTDPDVMDLLTYGIEDVNYILNDKGQIERLNNDYVARPENIGNPFITNTLADEDPDKWQKAIQQNQDAVVSPSLGFTFPAQSFTYTDKDEEGNDITVTVTEPDCFEIIDRIVAERYPALMAGNAMVLDFEDLHARATEDIVAEYTNKLDLIYRDSILYSIYEQRITAEVTAKQGPAIRKEVEAYYIEMARDAAERQLRSDIRAQLTEEHPELSSSEIYDMLDEIVNEKLIAENTYLVYTEEELNEMIEEDYQNDLYDAIDEALYEALDSEQFDKDYQKIQQSEDYQRDLNQMLTYDAPAKIEQRFDTLISAELLKYTDEMKTAMGDAVEKAITDFVKENHEALGMTEEEMMHKLGVMKQVRASSDGSEDGTDETSEESGETEYKYEYAYETWYDFIFEELLKSAYYDVFGSPSAN